MEIVNLQIDIEKVARKQLIDIFQKIGFVDGASLTEDELEKETKPIFWEEILNVELAQRKSYYIVFSLGELTNSVYADNDLVASYINISINIFSSNELSSIDTYNIRADLEKVFKNEKTIDYLRYNTKFFDSNTNLNQISYTAKMGCRLNG